MICGVMSFGYGMDIGKFSISCERLRNSLSSASVHFRDCGGNAIWPWSIVNVEIDKNLFNGSGSEGIEHVTLSSGW